MRSLAVVEIGLLGFGVVCGLLLGLVVGFGRGMEHGVDMAIHPRGQS